jgi:[acyl-carrier-protein] S-malonyltransferase
MRAYVFPGQGSQYAGMGRQLANTCAVARQTFHEADEALGFPLSRLCFEGPEETLKLTENTQPALLAVSIAVFRVLREQGKIPDLVAGHSLGEYSALVAAGSLDFCDALRLVRRRGQLMQEAVPVGDGAMVAIMGLDLEAVALICRRAAQNQVVAPANQNSPVQIAVAGHKEAVERVMDLAREAGARRVVPLSVSAPFHCPLMGPAQEAMEPLLREARFEDLQYPLVNNVDARRVTTAGEARDGLIRQIAAMVRWSEAVHKMAKAGADTFVEVGPGRVLTGLIRKTLSGVRTSSVEKPEQVKVYVETG